MSGKIDTVAICSEFALNELVFAKIKFSPPWPARIIKLLSGTKVIVEFLGDNRRTSEPMSTAHLTKLMDTHHNKIAEKGLKSNKAFRKAWEEAILVTALMDEESAKFAAVDAVLRVCEENSGLSPNTIITETPILPPYKININLNLRGGKSDAVIEQCSAGLQPIIKMQKNEKVIDVFVQLMQTTSERVYDSSDQDIELLAEHTPCTVQLTHLKSKENKSKNGSERATKILRKAIKGRMEQIAEESLSDLSDQNIVLLAECTPCTVQLTHLTVIENHQQKKEKNRALRQPQT